MIHVETPNLDQVLADLRRLQEAAELLDEVLTHVDPYKRKVELPEALHNKLMYFIGFDDSE